MVNAHDVGLLSLTSGIYFGEKKAYLSDFFRRFATRMSRRSTHSHPAQNRSKQLRATDASSCAVHDTHNEEGGEEEAE